MIFLINFFTLFALSFTSGPQNKTQGLESVLQNETFQQLIFSADITGAQKFIFQFALSHMLKNHKIEKSNLNSEMLKMGLLNLQPKISAIIINDKLSGLSNPLLQRESARNIVEEGTFRRLSIKGSTAPITSEVALRWAKGTMRPGDTSALREERSDLLKQAEIDLNHEILKATGQF